MEFLHRFLEFQRKLPLNAVKYLDFYYINLTICGIHYYYGLNYIIIMQCYL